MGKETIGAKFESETVDAIKEYQEKHDIETKSEALRQLVEHGLGRPGKKDQLKSAAGMTVPFATFALVLGMSGGTMRFTTGGGLFFTMVGGLLCLYAYYNCKVTE